MQTTLNTRSLGLAYEIQIRDFILAEKNQCYLWQDCPETILLEHKIINSHNDARIIRKDKKENPLMDTGVDIIQINDNRSISFVQCKNGYKNGITINDLAGYLFMMNIFNTLNGFVYYTSKLVQNLHFLRLNSLAQNLLRYHLMKNI
jgi:hypothetical protein